MDWSWLRRRASELQQRPTAIDTGAHRMGGAGASAAWEFTVALRKPTRGIRNNNPGNIRGGRVKWRGEVQRDRDGFVIFSTPIMGMRALGKLLLTYRSAYKLTTIAGIIGRWAPPVENDTQAYVRSVVKSTGLGATQQIDVRDPSVMRLMIHAIIRHENGSNPYSILDINEAVRRALEE